MALPILETATYELTLPSADVKVKYRPFLVKEEKVLLQALEANDDVEIKNAIKNIVSTCTFGQLDASNLPTFDLEYVFLQIRSKSVGEVAKFKVICPDDKVTATDVELDLDKVNVQVDDEHTNKIVIDEKRNLGIVLNYPSLGITKAGFDVNKTDTETMFKVIANCIDHIYEGDKVYPAKDSTEKELVAFLESITQKAFLDIKKFFDSTPQLRHEVEVSNPKTGVKSKVTFRGLQDFFQ